MLRNLIRFTLKSDKIYFRDFILWSEDLKFGRRSSLHCVWAFWVSFESSHEVIEDKGAGAIAVHTHAVETCESL